MPTDLLPSTTVPLLGPLPWWPKFDLNNCANVSNEHWPHCAAGWPCNLTRKGEKAKAEDVDYIFDWPFMGLK